MRNVIILFFSTIMITGLGFGLEENWPGLGLGLEHAVLEPIPGGVLRCPVVSCGVLWFSDIPICTNERLSYLAVNCSCLFRKQLQSKESVYF